MGLPANLFVNITSRKATFSNYRKHIINYLGFQKFDSQVEVQLKSWLEAKAKRGQLPNELFVEAQEYLLTNRIK